MYSSDQRFSVGQSIDHDIVHSAADATSLSVRTISAVRFDFDVERSFATNRLLDQ